MARALLNSLSRALRSPPDSDVGWCFGAVRRQSVVSDARQIALNVALGIEANRFALRVWITIAICDSPGPTTSPPVMAVSIGLPAADIRNAIRRCAVGTISIRAGGYENYPDKT
jgi:hypothetical protein